jgi:hypothetical protein
MNKNRMKNLFRQPYKFRGLSRDVSAFFPRLAFLFVFLFIFSPLRGQEAFVDGIIIGNGGVVAPGCPLNIDVRLRNCKDGAQMALIMAISSQCGFTAFRGGPSTGGQGNNNGGYLQGWDRTNFQDVIISSVPDQVPQINHRYQSGVDYYYVPYNCAGPINEFKGLVLCTQAKTHTEGCVNNFLLSSLQYSNGGTCSSGTVGTIT